MRSTTNALMAAGILSAALFTGPAALAQANYPTEPVRIVLGFPAGGPTDILSRIVAQHLSDRFSQQFIVDNRPGANGSTALFHVAEAKPDGYTLIYNPASALTVNPYIYPDVTYSIDDFTPIAPVLQFTGSVIQVSNKFSKEHNVRSIADLVAYAKANPGAVNMGSAGFGNNSHLNGSLLMHAAGIEMEHIPFQGAPPATLALIAGEIDFYIASALEATPTVLAGDSVALAVISPQRLETLPDVPTITEAGYPGVNFYSYHSLLGPAGLPKDIVATIEQAVREIVQSPEVAARFTELKVTATPGTAEEIGARLRGDVEKMIELVKTFEKTPPKQ